MRDPHLGEDAAIQKTVDALGTIFPSQADRLSLASIAQIGFLGFKHGPR